MTGPEHYEKAEQLDKHAAKAFETGVSVKGDQLIARAQVHATLALAGATLDAAHRTAATTVAWRLATGKYPASTSEVRA